MHFITPGEFHSNRNSFPTISKFVTSYLSTCVAGRKDLFTQKMNKNLSLIIFVSSKSIFHFALRCSHEIRALHLRCAFARGEVSNCIHDAHLIASIVLWYYSHNVQAYLCRLLVVMVTTITYFIAYRDGKHYYSLRSTLRWRVLLFFVLLIKG